MKIEREGDGRWQVRGTTGNRLGLIMGGHRRYVAESTAGETIGVMRSLRAAAEAIDREATNARGRAVPERLALPD